MKIAQVVKWMNEQQINVWLVQGYAYKPPIQKSGSIIWNELANN